MAKNYRREKIVKSIQKLELRRKNYKIRLPIVPATQPLYDLFGILIDDLLIDIIRELRREFDIKEEEIT